MARFSLEAGCRSEILVLLVFLLASFYESIYSFATELVAKTLNGSYKRNKCKQSIFPDIGGA